MARTIAAGIGILVALALAAAVPAVLGAWSEPEDQPPVGSRTAPLNVGTLTQERTKLGARDFRVDDIAKWATQLLQRRSYVNLGIAAPWIAPYQLVAITQSNSAGTGPNPALNSWQTVTIDPNDPQYAGFRPNALANPQTIRALELKVQCGEAYVWVFDPATAADQNPAIEPLFSSDASPAIACIGGDDDADTHTLMLPVAQAANGTVAIRYRVKAKDPPTVGAAIHLVGMYYEHEVSP